MKKEEIDKEMLDWKVPVVKTKAEAWEDLMSKIDQTDQSTKNTKVISFRKKVAIFVAVAAVTMWGALYFSSKNINTFHYATKQTKAFVLPDGSKVWANANTDIKLNPDTWDEQRELTLDGEAYFEVKKGSSFIVNTTHGDVTVLGTSFNVLDRAEFFEVECYTGKVAVKANDTKQVLTPGKATRLIDNQLETIYSIQELQADWISNKFRFENQSLTRVFDELSETYHVTCQLNFSEEKFFTGNFDIEDLESTLKTICLPMELKYSIEGNNVIISE